MIEAQPDSFSIAGQINEPCPTCARTHDVPDLSPAWGRDSSTATPGCCPLHQPAVRFLLGDWRPEQPYRLANRPAGSDRRPPKVKQLGIIGPPADRSEWLPARGVEMC